MHRLGDGEPVEQRNTLSFDIFGGSAITTSNSIGSSRFDAVSRRRARGRTPVRPAWSWEPPHRLARPHPVGGRPRQPGRARRADQSASNAPPFSSATKAAQASDPNTNSWLRSLVSRIATPPRGSMPTSTQSPPEQKLLVLNSVALNAVIGASFPGMHAEVRSAEQARVRPLG